MNFVVKETSLEESLKVFTKIPEWNRPEAGTVDYCLKRINGRDNLILSAYVNNENVGYFIAYEENGDFYCWVAAIVPEYRRMGILKEMLNICTKYAKEHGYHKLTAKTMNNKRELLYFAVKNGWNFVKVVPMNNILENEIFIEKEI